MNLEVNNLPELSMSEITRQLFNQPFLSDLQFHVGGQLIYAHSLELMKRSRTFEEQLKSNLGENKLISIGNFSYNSFYQFLRFIYLDECEITDELVIELLKLSIQYKVIKLENRVIDVIEGDDLHLALLEFCIVENYNLQYDRVKEIVAINLSSCLKLPRFETIHPDVLEEILNFDSANAKEIEILAAFLRWMQFYCEQKQIVLAERREHLDKYIRLIRFPTMTIEEFRSYSSQISGLLTDEDYAHLFKQIVKGFNVENDMWNSRRRTNYTAEYASVQFFTKTVETKFSVPNKMLLTGLRYGNNLLPTSHKIQILGPANNEIIQFETGVTKHYGSKVISLGESIRLQSDVEYTIKITYLRQSLFETILCRKPPLNIITHGCSESVRMLKPGLNMIAMFFQPVGDQEPVVVNQELAKNECSTSISNSDENVNDLNKLELKYL